MCLVSLVSELRWSYVLLCYADVWSGWAGISGGRREGNILCNVSYLRNEKKTNPKSVFGLFFKLVFFFWLKCKK